MSAVKCSNELVYRLLRVDEVLMNTVFPTSVTGTSLPRGETNPTCGKCPSRLVHLGLGGNASEGPRTPSVALCSAMSAADIPSMARINLWVLLAAWFAFDSLIH